MRHLIYRANLFEKLFNYPLLIKFITSTAPFNAANFKTLH